MNTTTQPNEPAVPHVVPVDLRDYFAAKAMAECMTAAADHTDDGSPMSELFQRAATFSYAYADAMLRARSQP